MFLYLASWMTLLSELTKILYFISNIFLTSKNLHSDQFMKNALFSICKAQNNSNQEQLNLGKNRSVYSILCELKKINYEGIWECTESKFIEMVRRDVQFYCYMPKAISLIGDYLLKNGLFHHLWGLVIQKNQFIKLDQFMVQYYQKYGGNIIVDEYYGHFEEIFNSQKKIKNDEDTNHTQRNQHYQQFEHDLERSYCEEQQSFCHEQDQSKQNVPESFTSMANSSLEKSNFYQPLSPCTHRIRILSQQLRSNQQRFYAEMICCFLNIRDLYELDQVDICSIYQCYDNQQFQLAIVDALNICQIEFKVRIHQQCSPKRMIMGYKILGLEYLIRIQKKYGKIEGFITYNQRIQLKQSINQKLNKWKQQTYVQ